MTTRLVYMSPQHYGANEAIVILSPKQFDDILSEGWEITSREKQRVKHPDTGKTVTVERIQLDKKSKKDYVPHDLVVADKEKAERRARRELRAQRHERRSRGLAVVGENPDGYLGRSIASSIPGVKVFSASMTAAAFGLGADCAKTGGDLSDNTFPVGSEPYRKWLDGFLSAQGPLTASQRRALADGAKAAEGEDDDEASCPYAVSEAEYHIWLWSFEKNGGKII